MKRGSTLFLKSVVILIGIAALALSIFLLLQIVPRAAEMSPKLVYMIIDLYLTTIPFFFALYQTWKLFGYIDKNNAFSELSVKALKNIKYSAIIISIFFLACMPVIYLIADADDAPGLILVGLAISFAPIVIAAFTAVLQKLLQEAIAIKSKND